MTQLPCSNNECPEQKQETTPATITLKRLGVDFNTFNRLSDLGAAIETHILGKVLRMSKEELSEVYSQAGIIKPHIDHTSMQGFYYALLWLHLSGRTKLRLNNKTQVVYLKGLETDPDKCIANVMSAKEMEGNLASILAIPPHYSWLLRHLVSKLMYGTPEDRRAVLTEIIVRNGHTLPREDYQNVMQFYNKKSFKYKGQSVCSTDLNLHCLLDQLRFSVEYRGQRLRDLAPGVYASDTDSENVATMKNTVFKALRTL